MKFGMYTRGANENSHHINVVEATSLQEAIGYFAGMKRLSISEFKNLFVVRQINNSINENKNLLLG
tara:strand:- start:146 stop:343 length:198 start_codon:yes stop_codon:yes gene_type:complete